MFWRLGKFRPTAAVSALLMFAAAVQAPGRQAPAKPVVLESIHDLTPQLRHMPPISPAPDVLKGVREIPRKMLPHREGSVVPAESDPVVQDSIIGPGAPTIGVSFDGVNNVDGVLPPDPTGAIGPNHYVQMVNLSFAVYDRTGNRLYGPVDNNTLWQGFPGVCGTSNDGDPIVLYDHLADRWLMTQFALPNYPFGPFYQCLAVSKSGDPLGQWHRYEFKISDTKMNDYPKFGVWPDGYYMSVNQFKQVNLQWAGAGAVVFERDKMLAGAPARALYFDLYNVDPNLGGMLPADLDGQAPPPGEPNYFVQIDDNAWGYAPDQVQIWAFRADWNNPANSTFTRRAALNVAAFDANMCGYSRNCIPQPGGTNVDAISDRAMFRLQYRNFGTHRTMVLNHTVDAGGDHAGIRWYELRETAGSWSIYQQGTYAPDGHHRWMGSIAMNGAGDIGLGFSISSTSVYPSVRATGRLAGDSTGLMTQPEIVIAAGSGYQTHSSGRWGDYSHLSVDPTDDCSFWYTQEYYATVGAAPWRTRIGSFKLRDCGGGGEPPAAPTNLAAASVSSSQIDLSWVDNSGDEDGFKIERCPGAGCTNFAQIATVGSNVTSYSDTGLAAATTYRYRVFAFRGAANSGYSNVAEATTEAAAGPPAAPSGLTAKARTEGKGKNQTYAGAVDLAWSDNSNNEDRFVLQRCEGQLIGKGKSKQVTCPSEAAWGTIAGDVPPGTTTYADTGALANTTYLYRVRAENAAGVSDWSNEASVTTPPSP